MAFAERLKHLREQSGLTQAALAEKLGVTQRAISHYEKGKGTPNLNFIHEVAQAFNISPNELLIDSAAAPRTLRLIDKLKSDTASGKLKWAKIDNTNSLVLLDYHIDDNRTYEAKFGQHGGFILAYAYAGISLFTEECGKILFIDNSLSAPELDTLYNLVADSASPHSQLIDKYLNTPL
jgi:toxin-antitoxin system, antitoxin component, xre family